jgi:hypothetical protein
MVGFILLCASIVGLGCQNATKDPVRSPDAKTSMLDDTVLHQLNAYVSPSGTTFTSEEDFRRYIRVQWQHLALQDPLQQQPKKATYVETAWAPDPENLYVALYPVTTATNLLDFDIYVAYTSSIHQDLIRDGKADLQYFYPEAFDAVIDRFCQSMSSVEFADDHDLIVKRLQSFNLPAQTDWITDLRFKSAMISANETNVIEMVAATEDGFLLLFSIDG